MEIEKKLGTPKVDLGSTEAIVCKKCGCPVFVDGVLFRKVPAFLTGEGKPGLIPIQVFQCAECHCVPEEMLPVELKDLDQSWQS